MYKNKARYGAYYAPSFLSGQNKVYTVKDIVPAAVFLEEAFTTGRRPQGDVDNGAANLSL